MSTVDRRRRYSSNGHAGAARSSGAAPAVFTVAFVAAVAAAGAVYALGGLLGLGVSALVGLAGGATAAALAARSTGGAEAKAAALLRAATATDASTEPPMVFRSEPWGTLYREVAGSVAARHTASMAMQELERMRRGKDTEAGSTSPPSPEPMPLREPAPQPLREPAAFEPAAFESRPMHEPAAFESRPVHADSDLVGGTTEPPAPQPPDPAVTAALVAKALEPYREGLEEIDSDLDIVARSLVVPAPPTANGNGGAPAAMVDALVQTAADGIEDLAAGLMRASELAGVAERVTNRATLLALNAALEATRSGSEAFASIAEETRRLAEYAREATDTISRLSGEIENKVGETIASIHSSSEDAKAAVASMGAGMPAGHPVASPETVAALKSLRHRVRRLLKLLDLETKKAPPAGDGGEPARIPGRGDAAERDEAAPPSPESDDSPRMAGGFDLAPTAIDRPLQAQQAEESGPGARESHGGFGGIARSERSDSPPHAVGEPPSADGPSPSPQIPDWLEGIQPRGRHQS